MLRENSILNLSLFSTDENATYQRLGDSNKSLGLSLSFIQNSKSPDIHYRCPKCYNFPLIKFLNKDIISYKCGCIENKKNVKIKDLFIKEKKYMTFLNDSKSDNIESDKIEKMNQNIGFKCTSHSSIENNEFRYYCLKCNENLCRDCVQNHIFQKKANYFLHDLIIFDFQNIEIYQKVKEIQDKLELENKSDNDKNISSLLVDSDTAEKTKEKTEEYKKIIKVDDNQCKIITKKDTDKKENEDYIELSLSTYLSDY